ncbi:carotenoid biosynthesis protein [Mucilaginibacter limnophilus]|uniref:Carotenoid biosynthesis protein n=1 Tax=Mucilaginibacter limnophilus TaxID=1932778 RepID=A0A3S2UMD0_9SPHI|nr:carotenoid biosynthesis protein [Mucilaginibacter limnophilus]RVT98261.1 carotenoid biosynthesis protein [Mucilaginibacter limnophilus]
MERQKSITYPAVKKQYAPPRTGKWLVTLILLFHAVGIVGFTLIKTRPFFLVLVPFHLLLMTVLVVKSHNRLSKKFLYFFIITALAGFITELVGTATGLLFGTYSYGSTLGIKAAGVPLLMGLLWFLMIYSAGVTMRLSGLKYIVLRVLIGAALLTALDWLIEPVAIKFDYWNWKNNIIPMYNYVCWFGLSLVLLLIFELFRFKKQSGVAVVFLITQFIFFIALRYV